MRQNAAHTPFRNSILTKALQEYFIGRNKVVMIACINSESSCYQETINTLGFAQRVSGI